MFRAGTSDGLIYSRLNIAFGLAADGGQFGDNKVARPFQHPLLAERERLEIAQIGQMLEHIGYFKNISGAHFLRELFETIFPVVRRKREIIRQQLEEHFAFA